MTPPDPMTPFDPVYFFPSLSSVQKEHLLQRVKYRLDDAFVEMKYLFDSLLHLSCPDEMPINHPRRTTTRKEAAFWVTENYFASGHCDQHSIASVVDVNRTKKKEILFF